MSSKLIPKFDIGFDHSDTCSFIYVHWQHIDYTLEKRPSSIHKRCPPDVSALTNLTAIQQALVEYKQAGGQTIVDCQPGGSGRDGGVLVTLAHSTSIHIVSATGFHLKKYYPPDY